MNSMNHPPRIGCLIMAAGNASRFGSNKLAAKVDGKMLIEHALETVPREEFAHVTVVTQYDEVLVLARRFGFTVLVNPFPEWGASHTVRLGTEAMADCDAILYQVADQPLLRRESVRAEVEFFRRHPDRIVAMGHGGVRGNADEKAQAYVDGTLEYNAAVECTHHHDHDHENCSEHDHHCGGHCH